MSLNPFSDIVKEIEEEIELIRQAIDETVRPVDEGFRQRVLTEQAVMQIIEEYRARGFKSWLNRKIRKIVGSIGAFFAGQILRQAIKNLLKKPSLFGVLLLFRQFFRAIFLIIADIKDYHDVVDDMLIKRVHDSLLPQTDGGRHRRVVASRN